MASSPFVESTGQTWQRASSMIELTISTLGLIALATLWLLLGVFRALREALSERATDWLLPPSQPTTFRLAQFVAFLCTALTPRRLPRFRPGPSWLQRWHYLFPVEWEEVDWPDPEAALAELEADLLAERRVLDPLRLTCPLLPVALRFRLRFAWRLAVFFLWLPIGVLVYVLDPLALHEELRVARIRKEMLSQQDPGDSPPQGGKPARRRAR